MTDSTTPAYDPHLSFDRRVRSLPFLRVAISREFGARHQGVDILALRRDYPELVHFLEIGVDLERGIDRDARAWAQGGGPTTYHFLDLNLEDASDLDEGWMDGTFELSREVGASWVCGDAGLWHIGPRDRGHGCLLPPVLEPSVATEMAANVRRLRERWSLEVLPENPPAHTFVGRLHLLDFFARVGAEADCGLLLDVAHLAVYQHVQGLAPLTALEGFPCERIVEIHVAGGTPFEFQGRTFVEDDHGTHILPATWEILDHVLERAPNLRAVVFEGERNALEDLLPVFELLDEKTRGRFVASEAVGERASARRASEHEQAGKIDHRGVQRQLFRMHLDPAHARRIRAGEDFDPRLGQAERQLLQRLDLAGVLADPGNKRRQQLLGNIALEYELFLAACGSKATELLSGFPSSPQFHAAIRDDGALVLAFGAWAAGQVQGGTEGALLALERALAEARRGSSSPAVALAPGWMILSGRCRLIELPKGTLEMASRARAALDHGRSLPPARQNAGTEWILVHVPDRRQGEADSARSETLDAPVDELLRRARVAVGPEERGRFARAHGTEPEDLEAFLRSFIEDGVLLGS